VTLNLVEFSVSAVFYQLNCTSDQRK